MKKFHSIKKLSEIDIRFLFLLGLLVFLPGFEVLKNLFAILFVLSWVVVAKKNKYWGGKWRVIDSIFLLWILADITADPVLFIIPIPLVPATLPKLVSASLFVRAYCHSHPVIAHTSFALTLLFDP